MPPAPQPHSGQQGGRCWLQRLSAAGKRILRVPTVMSGAGHDVFGVANGAGGTWVTDAVARGLRLRHIDAVGRFVTGGASGTIVPLALTAPTVGHPQSNRTGDLFVSYAGTISGLLRAGVARVTFTGATARVALAGTASKPPLVAADGAGGAFAVWQAAGHATIARLGFAGRSLTCEPTATVLRYGSRVTISGYALSGRYVATGVRVTIPRKTGAGNWVTVAGATTSAEGYYAVSVAPRSNSR